MQHPAQTGAQAFVEALIAAGITHIYGIPGEENTALMQAIEGTTLSFVLTRHEQGAAFMAAVHGRITGTPAACLATLGPGATNLVTGVADAHLDRVPMLVITAQAERRRTDTTVSHQVLDLGALFQPITKASTVLTDAASISGAVAEAVRRAADPHPGPVHLSLPVDVAAAQIRPPVAAAPPIAAAPPLPNPSSVLEAATQLRAAQRPLMVVGPGVLRAGAAEHVRVLAEAANIPVATSLAAKGILPADHALSLFAIGLPFEDHVDAALAACDAILAVGFDAVEYPPRALTRDGTIPVIHLSERPAAIDAGWRVVADVAGHLPSSLKALGAALDGLVWQLDPAWSEARDRMRAERHWIETPGDAMRAFPQDICHVIEQDLHSEDTVLSGVGAHKLWIARHIAPRRPGQLIVPNGLAGMGLALPGAIAAAGLQSEGRVLAICGDGDFLMNVQEMETATRLRRPLTVMIWDDGGYGLIEWEQTHQTGQTTNLRFGNPNWGDLARAFGWDHHPMERFADLGALMQTTREAERPALITVAVDYSPNLDLSSDGAGTYPAAQR